MDSEQAFRKKKKKKEKEGRKHDEVKPIVTRSHTFSRASPQPRLFALTFDWFTGLSLSFVVSHRNWLSLLNKSRIFFLSEYPVLDTEETVASQVRRLFSQFVSETREIAGLFMHLFLRIKPSLHSGVRHLWNLA